MFFFFFYVFFFFFFFNDTATTEIYTLSLHDALPIHAIAATPCSGSSTAKGAVHALTKNLAIELAKDNIRVNCVAPAVVRTPLFDKLMSPEQVEQLSSLHPLGRIGESPDISEAVIYLAGENGKWITGQIIAIDGGITAGNH